MALRTYIALALVLVTVAAGVALDAPAALRTAGAASGVSQNDAGSRDDAGNSPESATLVASTRRMYSANLTPPGTDADWYRHDVSQPFCTTVTTTTSTPGHIELRGAVGAASVARDIEPRRGTTLALAAPAGHTPLFGFEPGFLGAQAISAGHTHPEPGRYTFAFESAGYAALDPEGDGEGIDAGATAQTAAPVPAPCFAGRLATGDGADAFYLDVASERELTVSFARASGASARLELRSPSGDTILTVEDGEVGTTWTYETGRWTLVVLPASGATSAPLAGLAGALPGVLHTVSPASGASDYLVGVTDDGGTNPCRPAC